MAISWVPPAQVAALTPVVNLATTTATGATIMNALKAVFIANPGLCARLVSDSFNNIGVSRSGSLVAGAPGPTGPLDLFAAAYEAEFVATTFA